MPYLVLLNMSAHHNDCAPEPGNHSIWEWDPGPFLKTPTCDSNMEAGLRNAALHTGAYTEASCV